MKQIKAYAIFKLIKWKVVTSLRIQNRWIVFGLFLICAILVVIGLQQYRQTKTVDLSDTTINNIQLNQTFNDKGYEINKKIKMERFKFYSDKEHPNLTVKVRQKDNVVKGIMLVKDSTVNTSFDGNIGESIDDVINQLGFNYKKNIIGKKYESIKYLDRDHHMKLNLLCENREIKRIEFFSH
nr:hypothetical protein [Staphylococcus simiae]